MTFGIMFHHFYDNTHPQGQGAINCDELRNIINHVKKQHNILSALDYYDKFLTDSLNENDVCLTFDDGLLCQYDVALPVLTELRLTAFWFVYSSVFEGCLENIEIYRLFRNTYFNNIDHFYDLFFKKCDLYLNDEERSVLLNLPVNYLSEFPFYSENDKKFRFMRDITLKRARYEKIMDFMLLEFGVDKTHTAKKLWLNNDLLKSLHDQGHIIGAHSYSHPTRLVNLTQELQFNEYFKNIKHIEFITGIKPMCMAHPCNSYDKNTIDILSQLGFKLGFRSNRAQKTYTSLECSREDHMNLLKL